MIKRQKVNCNTELQLSKGVTRKGFDFEEAPLKSAGMFRTTIEKFLSLDFGNRHQHPEDYYFMPGIHDEKTYRYRVIDSDFDHKDKFKFFLFPIDIDVHTKDGRAKWKNQAEPEDVIKLMWKRSKLSRESAALCSSAGGVRMTFISDKMMNSLEWRWYYDNIVTQLCNEFGGAFGKYGKMTFDIGNFNLVLDPRNPGSLTRVPYGFRSGAPVVESKYFYSYTDEKFLPHDYFGKIKELEKIRCDVPGYEVVDITRDMKMEKRGIPKPKNFPRMPKGLTPFSWYGEPPAQGQREIAIFSAVSNAKRQFTNRLTPEQYYAYFYKAIIEEMDTSNAAIPAQVQLWNKILRDWYVESEAETIAGKKLDMTHSRNAGNRKFYHSKEFDNQLDTKEVYDYTNKNHAAFYKEMSRAKTGAFFFNSPPGASKSTIAVKLLEEFGGIYIAPSNKQIKDLAKKITRKRVNFVLSYRELIPIICPDEESTKILQGKYDNEYTGKHYSKASLAADRLNIGDPTATPTTLNVKRGQYYYVKTFPEFIKEFYPIESKKLVSENKIRTEKLEAGHTSLLTHAKFMTLINRPGVHELPATHQIIFDEVEQCDIVDPEKYAEERTISIYGKECASPVMKPERQVQQENFQTYLHEHKTIFINADEGLETALEFNGFKDVKVLGDKMRSVIDDHVHVVLCPDMAAGFAEFKNVEDLREISPRAVYAGHVNEETYTLITNGADIKGRVLSKNNLKNAIGSNDFLNSRLVAILTYPTPEQVANVCFSSGIKPEQSRKLIFQNLINQIVSRNTGYRCLDVINSYSRKYGEELRTPNNEMILILPESARLEHLNLIVKTTNVWTVKSKNVPKHIAPYLDRIKLALRLRRELYNIEPGTSCAGSKILKKYKTTASKLAEIIDDPMLADFELKRRGTLDGKRCVNVIQRHETVNAVLRQCLGTITAERTRLKDFYRMMVDVTSAKFIKNMLTKDLKNIVKAECFRYNFRVVKIRGAEYICRTDEEMIFF